MHPRINAYVTSYRTGAQNLFNYPVQIAWPRGRNTRAIANSDPLLTKGVTIVATLVDVPGADWLPGDLLSITALKSVPILRQQTLYSVLYAVDLGGPKSVAHFEAELVGASALYNVASTLRSPLANNAGIVRDKIPYLSGLVIAISPLSPEIAVEMDGASPYNTFAWYTLPGALPDITHRDSINVAAGPYAGEYSIRGIQVINGSYLQGIMELIDGS